MNKRGYSNGFSIVETMVVVALVAILTFFGIENVVKFQQNAILDSATSQFANTLRSAKSKSVTNQSLEEDISYFDPYGLPEHGINVTGSTVTQYIIYTKNGEVTPTKDIEEIQTIDSAITLTSGETVFARNSGKVSGNTNYTISFPGAGTRQISIDSSGLITVSTL